MVQALRGLWQPVTLGQATPAVGPANKLVGESQFELRVRGEGAQGANPQSLGVGGAHGQRVAIVKPQGHGHAQAQRCQGLVHLLQRQRAGALENLLADGAHIFGVQVYLPRAQGLVHDGRVTKPLAHLGRCAGMGRGLLRQQLGQDVRLGEALGAYAQRRGWVRSQGGHARAQQQ